LTRTHQPLVSADDINLLAKTYKLHRKTQTLELLVMDIGLDIAENTKYCSCLMKRMQ